MLDQVKGAPATGWRPDLRLARSPVEILPSGALRRTVTVKPGMCGSNSLFVGQVGDWTWETVSVLCSTNVFAARSAAGDPTYLAFYYFHVQAGDLLHPGLLSFGDELEVVSMSFDFGAYSILTLHRICPAGGTAPPASSIDPVEFYERPRADCLYVENFNRWVSRRGAGNESLAQSSPLDFAFGHLPKLPGKYSPRRVYGAARARGSFHDPADGGYEAVCDGLTLEYPIDITRDVNGVGLVYFASYFSIIDRAVLAAWRWLGRDGRTFLARSVLDHKLCYLGNADLHSVLTASLTVHRNVTDPTLEIFNVRIANRDTGRPVAVSTILIRVSAP
jgi:probable biosynthetic protein (TIGR04098 family)